MSPIGPENFHRLEEFPSYLSCIKCFGRPIIPPLLTPSRRHELRQLRAMAVNREVEKLRKKELFILQKQDDHIAPKSYRDDDRLDFQSSIQESCALWFPSAKDCPEGISVAISKFPTSGIYSSVHTGAIVCSNVIENSHAYSAGIMRDSLLGSRASVVDCVECSHNNINLDCSLCQEEYNQSFHNKSFTSEISPEVPCRTFSLLQQNVDVLNDELNCAADETECESLPTVICNQKYVPFDTDSESNTTCITQSTDLEKYMEFPCEFSSPDNSAVAWDSKSTSQQYTLSRSDDASSETMVNTENDLTPCASTMAELTDNIEDELSNAEETAAVSDNKEATVSGTMKRAHSVDSYMKIIQTCAKSMNVKKSLSEPFTTDQNNVSGSVDEIKTPVSFKTGLLIKEDSKESEESKDVPEKDITDQENNKGISSNENDKNSEIKADGNNSFRKKHIRQNSYTLDHPSSALISAHADCTCNFDVNCISPHCSALEGEKEILSNAAFTKEKVEVDIPVSHDQMKKIPILSSVNLSEDIISNQKEDMTATVDVFPVVKEDSCEKSNSGNAQESEAAIPENTSTAEINNDSKLDVEHLSEVFKESFNITKDDKNKDYLKQIYQETARNNFMKAVKELQESHEMRVKQLFEEQHRQWLKLQEEFNEQERCLSEEIFLHEKIKQTIIPSGSPPKDKEKIDNECCNSWKTENKPVSDEELSISNSSISSPQIPASDSSLIKNSELSVPGQSLQFLHSPSKSLTLPQNTRASIPPSTEFSTSNTSPSKPVENIKGRQLFEDSDISITCNFKSNENHINSHFIESLPNMNGFPCKTSNLLPHSGKNPQPPNAVVTLSNQKCDNVSTYFCDKSVHQCKCCTSVNGYCEYDINNSHPESLPTYQEQNLFSSFNDLSSDTDFLHFPNTSSASVVQSKNLNPGSFITCQNGNNSRKMSSSSKTVSDCVSATENATFLPAFNDVESSSVVNIKDRINVLPQTLKDKTKLSMDSIVSLCAKTSKNRPFSQDATISKRAIDDPVFLKKIEKLPAFVKGYLTRRLFKTERVQNLIKTLQDTALLIGKLSEDLSSKGDSVSERDVDFHRQLIVQLMSTFHNVYDIFCTISTKERMSIIAESRNIKLRQKMLDQKPESDVPVTTKSPDPAPSIKHNLTSATLKALERKRSSAFNSRTYTVKDLKNARSRSVIEMRTYTIDDLPNFRGRTNSSTSKGLSVSPTSIYKTSIGMCMKRKTASAKSSGSRRSLHKWVP